MELFFEVIIMGLVLSADSFSAAVAMGSKRFSRRELLTFAAVSGLAETVSAVAGYFAGSRLISIIRDYDHWVAFGLLTAISLHLLYEGVNEFLKSNTEEPLSDEFRHGFIKIALVAIATSLDAFGVGIGLGVAERPIIPFSISIGFWAFAATLSGVYIGNRASRKLGPVFTVLAGLVLGGLAVRMLDI